jgi:DNA-binding MarR family transcriptional regulator
MNETARQAALSDLYALAGHLLWRATARVTVALGRILPGGIDIHAYAALLALADQEPQSQRSLATLTGVSRTTMTSVAQTLHRDALVERVRNSEDRRSYSLSRTSTGRAAVRQWAPHMERLEHRLTATFSPADASRLREVLVQVIGDQLDDHTPQALLESTGFLVTRAHQRTHREFAAALHPLDIEPRHIGTLRALRVAGPATQNDLGVLLEVSPATVVQIVDHLERRGLVTRERDASDRRVHRLHLTDEAVTVIEQAAVISTQVLDDRIGGPGSRAHRDLVRLLTRLLSAPAAG